MNKNSIAIIGAGKVGSATAYSILKSNVFSTIYLIDTNKKLVNGDILDFEDAQASGNNNRTKVCAGTYEDLKKCSFVVITAGISQATRGSRLEQTTGAVAIFDSILKKIKDVKYNEFIIICSNPVDVLTWYTYKKLNYDRRKIIGTGTSLDTHRFKCILSREFNVSPKEIHAFCLGEHGKSVVPIYSQAKIYSIPLQEYQFLHNRYLEYKDITEEIKHRGYQILSLKGATFYGIAECVLKIILNIYFDNNEVMPVSLINDEGTIANSGLGILNCEGVRQYNEIEYSEHEYELLEASNKTILDTIKKYNLDK